ncbi:MAG: hypothetical protein RLZZ618_2427 [Pseudomonadota bacterium]|jgi:ribosomal protein S18 acetylase RimI-like enzyme
MTLISTYADDTHRSQVADLWARVFAYGDAHNAPAVTIDKKLALNDGLFFVAVADNRVVGTAMAGYDGHRGWLYAVAVDPLLRHQKLGSALVRHAEQALIERGCMKINLQIVEGNDAVAAFYETLGYATEQRISMGKKIAANVPGDRPKT